MKGKELTCDHRIKVGYSLTGHWPMSPIKQLCECGCEKIASSGKSFLKGHFPRNKETRDKMINSLKKHYEDNPSAKKGKILVEGEWILKTKIKFPKCKCGCGKKVTNLKHKFFSHECYWKSNQIYKSGERLAISNKGKSPWNKGLTKETDERVNLHADKLRTKYPQLCECGCGEMTAPGSRFISGHNGRGVKQSEETIAKRVLKNKGQKRDGNWNPWSIGLTKETNESLAKSARKTSKTMKTKFKDSDFCKMWGSTHSVFPNKLELKVETLLSKLFGSDYKYVGDFDTFIGGKCPDFINVNGQKKIIEVFGDYWHDGDDPNDRISHFAKYGFKTLVLWESDIHNSPTFVKEQLMSFHHQ